MLQRGRLKIMERLRKVGESEWTGRELSRRITHEKTYIDKH